MTSAATIVGLNCSAEVRQIINDAAKARRISTSDLLRQGLQAIGVALPPVRSPGRPRRPPVNVRRPAPAPLPSQGQAATLVEPRHRVRATSNAPAAAAA